MPVSPAMSPTAMWSSMAMRVRYGPASCAPVFTSTSATPTATNFQ